MKISKILAGMSAMALAGSMMTMAASAMEPANASGKTVFCIDIPGVYEAGNEASSNFKATLKEVKLDDKAINFDASKVKYGNIENDKSNYRIEMYNEYGSTKADDPFTAADFDDYSSMDITFTVTDFESAVDKKIYDWDTTKTKKYVTAKLAFADGDWNPQDWSTSVNIDADGDYTIHYEKNLVKLGGGFASSASIKNAEDDDTKANGAVWDFATICADAGLTTTNDKGETVGDVSKIAAIDGVKVTVKVLDPNGQWGNGQIGVSTGKTAWKAFSFWDSTEGTGKDVNIDGEYTFEFPIEFTGAEDDSFLIKLEEYGGGTLEITKVEFTVDETKIPEDPTSSEESADSTDSDESKVILTDSGDSKTNSAATSSKAANNASNTNPSTGAAALAAVGVALAGAAVVATKKRK